VLICVFFWFVFGKFLLAGRRSRGNALSKGIWGFQQVLALVRLETPAVLLHLFGTADYEHGGGVCPLRSLPCALAVFFWGCGLYIYNNGLRVDDVVYIQRREKQGHARRVLQMAPRSEEPCWLFHLSPLSPLRPLSPQSAERRWLPSSARK
jgi:hypothetical protein